MAKIARIFYVMVAHHIRKTIWSLKTDNYFE